MPKRKTYLIASLLDECNTQNDIHCDTVKPIEIINKECETLREAGCSGYKEEQEQTVASKSHGALWRRALPMPLIRNQIQNFSENESSQYFLYRMPVQTHLQALAPYNMPCLSQLMSTRYQLMQMQQAAVQQLSSLSLTSALSPSLSSSTSVTSVDQQISSNQSNFCFLSLKLQFYAKKWI
ncbi:unnamed protein product [Acanthocheilonema viteae]|uniref:Uncharacterized protein n=1 Tax=Acanthocheilonema viteae TaxID=6277 RepID=A0A498SIS6_ACAVI|nr:unnamed protein product [Acanthocheilonema viteae]